jgi:hypothetical protein
MQLGCKVGECTSVAMGAFGVYLERERSPVKRSDLGLSGATVRTFQSKQAHENLASYCASRSRFAYVFK